uniref:CCHC-type domain-containing protein n=1 Tax=Tanacetum cinerariifolium TaxID=118510 RepID=A0A6L2LHE7_TANCI|nr:hypothetical protein CTI12_AA544960 [Tanacetum cinerariifolium]
MEAQDHQDPLEGQGRLTVDLIYLFQFREDDEVERTCHRKNLPKAKSTGKCHVCGDTGHSARDSKESKSDAEEVLLQNTTGKCHVCGETRHYAREFKDKKSDTVKVVLQETTRKCHLCGYTGHYARDCKERKSVSKKVALQVTAGKFNMCGETRHYARECKDKKSDTVKVVPKEIIGSGTRSCKKAQGCKCVVSVSRLDDLGYIVSMGIGGCVIQKSQKVIGQGHLEDGASHNGDALSSLFRLSLMEERPVKKVVLDETIGFLESNEHLELLKVRARGWYLLTRCTVHVCNSRDMFVDYQPMTGHEMIPENNIPVDVVVFGTVKLQLTSGKVLTLENVFHMPKITKCCISVSKLTKMGFTVGFWNEGCDIKKDHETVGIGYVEDELYRLGVVDKHPSADFDPMIDHGFNLDNDD